MIERNVPWDAIYKHDLPIDEWFAYPHIKRYMDGDRKALERMIRKRIKWHREHEPRPHRVQKQIDSYGFEDGVRRAMSKHVGTVRKIKRKGFDITKCRAHPIRGTREGDRIIVIDGAHRLCILRALGYDSVPEMEIV